MVRRKTIWIAELDNKQTITCESKKQAQQLEEEEKTENEIEKLQDTFCGYFKWEFGEEDRYNSNLYLCVDCGKKIMEYESEWDGHRSNRGDCIFCEAGSKLFDGWRCPDCHKKAIKLFQKMLLFHSEKSDIINLIDTTEWSSTRDKNPKTVLYFYKIVDFWDKNHKKRRKKS